MVKLNISPQYIKLYSLLYSVIACKRTLSFDIEFSKIKSDVSLNNILAELLPSLCTTSVNLLNKEFVHIGFTVKKN